MGYQNIYRVLCWMSLVLIAFGFLLSKNRPGQGAPAGEAVHQVKRIDPDRPEVVLLKVVGA